MFVSFLDDISLFKHQSTWQHPVVMGNWDSFCLALSSWKVWKLHNHSSNGAIPLNFLKNSNPRLDCWSMVLLASFTAVKNVPGRGEQCYQVPQIITCVLLQHDLWVYRALPNNIVRKKYRMLKKVWFSSNYWVIFWYIHSFQSIGTNILIKMASCFPPDKFTREPWIFIGSLWQP